MSSVQAARPAPLLLPLLDAHAAERADAVAFRFLHGGSLAEQETVTFGELQSRMLAVSHGLRASLEPGDRALLCYPPGLDFVAGFLGCLHAGVVAVPVVPPYDARASTQLSAVASDARVAALIGPAALLGPTTALMPESVLELDHAELAQETADPADQTASPSEIAFIQYTSGSTGQPKGVVVSHANIAANQQIIGRAFGHDEHSSVVSWLPQYHDMGLIGGVLHPLFIGRPCALMSPADFVREPANWLRAVSELQATTSGGPNFGYELCVARAAAPDRSLDLSGWKVAFNGAEPVRYRTLERFTRTFAPRGFSRAAFRPCYGLAEATLMVTGAHGSDGPRVCARPGDDATVDVSSGRVDPELPVRVLAADGSSLPDGQIGEIAVGGASVTSGYWGRETDVQEPLTRTGDLGYLSDGELFVCGRLKDVLIVNGVNHHATDLERTAEASHPLLRAGCVAAVQVTSSEGDGVAIVQEVARLGSGELPDDATLVDCTSAIRSAVPAAHGVAVSRVILMPPRSLPKTSSGKIRRSAVRDSVDNGSLEPAWDWRRQRIEVSIADRDEGDPRSITAATLGVAPSDVTDDLPLVALGLDSLSALGLAYALRAAGFDATPAELLAGVTLRDLPRLPEHPPEAAAGDAEPSRYRPTTAQESLLVADQLEPGQAVYTVSRSFELVGDVDETALRLAMYDLARRHPICRTRFVYEAGRPVAVVDPEPAPGLVRDHGQISDVEGLARQIAARRIDPGTAPLLRFDLATSPSGARQVIFSGHHIVLDLWSGVVFLDELGKLHAAHVDGTPAQLAASAGFGSFARGEPSRRQFWQAHPGLERLVDPLRSGIERVALRPPSTDAASPTAADTYELELAEADERAFATASRLGVTPFAVVAACLTAALVRVGHRGPLTLGYLVAGRGTPQFARTPGYFANLRALRFDGDLAQGLRQLALTFHRDVQVGLDLQDVPFADLLAEAAQGSVQATLGGPPLDVLVTLQRTQLASVAELSKAAIGLEAELPFGSGVQLRTVASSDPASEFPIDLSIAVAEGTFAGRVKCQRARVSAEDGAALASAFSACLRQLADDPDRPLSAAVAPTEEQRVLLDAWASSGGDYRRDESVLDLFLGQAEGNPAAIACEDGDLHVTYGELAAQVEQIARAIADARLPSGAQPGRLAPVALLARSSPQFVAQFFGALRAGRPVLPLAEDVPIERAAALVQRAGAVAVLDDPSGDGRAARIADCASRPLLDGAAEVAGAGHEPIPVTAGGDVYYLFTSGSTGEPKGLALTSDNLVPVLEWQRRHLGFDESSRSMQTLSLSFDFGLNELLTTLCFGGTLVFPAGRRLVLDPRRYALRLLEDRITHVCITASLLDELLRTGVALPSLRMIHIGAEPLNPDTVRRLAGAVSPDCRCYNGYGPTEASINTTMFELDLSNPDDVSIGRPTANHVVRVLDDAQRLVPPGVAGELCIGGPSVAAGYLQRPVETAAAFVADPYGAPGAEIYRTGDRVRFSTTGDLYFCGRIDDQIKVRGHRVEPGEIEAALRDHTGVDEVAVVMRRAAADAPELLAGYYVGDATPESVRQYAHDRLPAYMVPSVLVSIAGMPRSSNGKIDRRRLPALQSGAQATDVAAWTPLERLVHSAWEQTLGSFGDNPLETGFFDAGGTSLSVMRLQYILEQSLGREIEVAALFEHSTIRNQAAFFAGKHRTTVSTQNSQSVNRLAARRRRMTFDLTRL